MYFLANLDKNINRMEWNTLKSTGVVRRIDDLGRIVIPKEIRRNLKIRDGELMEIFVDMDSIILKKYSKLEDMLSITEKITEKLANLSNLNIIVTDRDHILSCSGKEVSNIKNELLSKELIELMDNRQSVNTSDRLNINITNTNFLEGYFYIMPMISENDSIGLIAVYSKQKLNESAEIIAKIIDFFLCSQININE